MNDSSARMATGLAAADLCRTVAAITCLAVTAFQGQSVQGAEPSAAEVRIGATQLDIRLGNGCRFEFARDGDLLLGLQKVSVGGVELKSDQTVQRPVLTQEWDRGRMIWPLLRFKDARQNGKGVEIVCELLGTSDEKAFRSFFMFGGNRDRALAEGMTPELQLLKQKADTADGTIRQAVENSAEYQQELRAIEAIEAKAAGEKDATAQKKTTDGAKRRRAKLPNLAVKLRPKVVAATPELAAAQRQIDDFERALEPVALRLGDIFRDFYRHAQIRQPAEICVVEGMKSAMLEWKDSCRPAGTLRWRIEPEERNVAGWRWVGWRQHFAFELAAGRKVNAIRVLGTWELDGKANDLTTVNLRYRGLGRIEQVFTARPQGGVREAWTTTEILPGAAGQTYAVSPCVPKSDVRELQDRGYALEHRVGAWICRMARGGGTGFVDFQYRPQAAFCAFPVRQGNVRALSECFPGDEVVSQTDEEYFALTDRGETIPMVYLALLSKDAPLSRDESRTRWQEMDQHVRDQVSAELGFVQHEPMPGIGVCRDLGTDYMKGMYREFAEKLVDPWADQGVKWIVSHQMKGWHDRTRSGNAGNAGRPMEAFAESYRAFTRACAKKGVGYFQWWGAGCGGAVPHLAGDSEDEVNAVLGEVPGGGKYGPYIAISAPGDYLGGGMGYGKPDRPRSRRGSGFQLWNPRHPKVFDLLLEEARITRDEYGLQGVWFDSFQNFNMSHLSWGDGSGDSCQRKWWEVAAAMSRAGIAFMVEGHAFPGLSCSIEVPEWEKDYWFFPYVWKWHRGLSQNAYSPEDLDDLCFRVMANKGWTAPDEGYKGKVDAIPDFKRFALEYVAALPMMRRPFVLGEERGVLWVGFDGDRDGVWFSFSEQAAPAGVQAFSISDQDRKPVARVERHRTYRVQSDDLLDAFGVRRGPLPDPRIGRKYDPPKFIWPAWTREPAATQSSPAELRETGKGGAQ